MGYKDKDKQREYQRKWQQNRRQAWFADKRCEICGATDNLELDHIDPAQKTHHAIWSWSEKRRNEEIAKCQVLCYTCHLFKTYIYDTKRKGHGTPACYWRGCRCDKCKSAHSKWQSDYRIRIGRKKAPSPTPSPNA